MLEKENKTTTKYLAPLLVRSFSRSIVLAVLSFISFLVPWFVHSYARTLARLCRFLRLFFNISDLPSVRPLLRSFIGLLLLLVRCSFVLLFVRSFVCSPGCPSDLPFVFYSVRLFIIFLTCQPARSAARSILPPPVRMYVRSPFNRSFVRLFNQSVSRSVGQSDS